MLCLEPRFGLCSSSWPESKYGSALFSQVDAFSWGIGLIIYLILGFSGGHAYASRVPFTFAVVLGLHLACLYATVFLQDRFVVALVGELLKHRTHKLKE